MPRGQEPKKDAETRRNVVGELHASDEPTESEWGNPSSVMGRDRCD